MTREEALALIGYLAVGALGGAALGVLGWLVVVAVERWSRRGTGGRHRR